MYIISKRLQQYYWGIHQLEEPVLNCTVNFMFRVASLRMRCRHNITLSVVPKSLTTLFFSFILRIIYSVFLWLMAEWMIWNRRVGPVYAWSNACKAMHPWKHLQYPNCYVVLLLFGLKFKHFLWSYMIFNLFLYNLWFIQSIFLFHFPVQYPRSSYSCVKAMKRRQYKTFT